VSHSDEGNAAALEMVTAMTCAMATALKLVGNKEDKGKRQEWHGQWQRQ
jgi:hypothetical protein